MEETRPRSGEAAKQLGVDVARPPYGEVAAAATSRYGDALRFTDQRTEQEAGCLVVNEHLLRFQDVDSVFLFQTMSCHVHVCRYSRLQDAGGAAQRGRPARAP